MPGFGLLPFGASPWGGPGQISLSAVRAIGSNELIAFFSSVPKYRDPLGYQDARNVQLWGIEPVDPITIGLGGEVFVEPGKRRPSEPYPWIAEAFVDGADPTQIHLRTATQLEPGAEYDVSVLGAIRGKDCESFGGLATHRVLARGRAEGARSRFAAIDTYRDIANPYFAVEPQTGKTVVAPGFWAQDDAGEYVLGDATASLKKRVLRRIQTETGGFIHLRNYGVRATKGQLARGPEVQAFAIRLQEQLLTEPDVSAASVTGTIAVTQAGSGIVTFAIVVKPRSSGEVSFSVQVSAGA
jgi:hypothetical protein